MLILTLRPKRYKKILNWISWKMFSNFVFGWINPITMNWNHSVNLMSICIWFWIGIVINKNHHNFFYWKWYIHKMAHISWSNSKTTKKDRIICHSIFFWQDNDDDDETNKARKIEYEDKICKIYYLRKKFSY